MTKISIITATWNSGATLRDTMESVLAQSYQDWEHIIVDGGSTDNTLDIVRELEPRYVGRLRWVSEPDRGIYDAMNKGIRMATGDVIGLLNSDDFYSSATVLERVAAEIAGTANEGGAINGTAGTAATNSTANGGATNGTAEGAIVSATNGGAANGTAEGGAVDAVYGDIHYVNPGDLTRCVRYYSSRGFRRWKMRLGFMPAHPSFYCRRTVYRRFGLFDTSFRVAADFEQLLRLIYVNRIAVRYVAMDFVTMRTGGASTSGLASHRRILSDHLRAYRQNGVRSNLLLESLRYPSKLLDLAKAKFIKHKPMNISIIKSGGVILRLDLAPAPRRSVAQPLRRNVAQPLRRNFAQPLRRSVAQPLSRNVAQPLSRSVAPIPLCGLAPNGDAFRGSIFDYATLTSPRFGYATIAINSLPQLGGRSTCVPANDGGSCALPLTVAA